MRLLEAEINGFLAALAPERRPKLATRRSACSVAFMTSTALEATDGNGNVECIKLATALNWMQK
jgi:hypothetical protein